MLLILFTDIVAELVSEIEGPVEKTEGQFSNSLITPQINQYVTSVFTLSQSLKHVFLTQT